MYLYWNEREAVQLYDDDDDDDDDTDLCRSSPKHSAVHSVWRSCHRTQRCVSRGISSHSCNVHCLLSHSLKMHDFSSYCAVLLWSCLYVYLCEVGSTILFHVHCEMLSGGVWWVSGAHPWPTASMGFVGVGYGSHIQCILKVQLLKGI